MGRLDDEVIVMTGASRGLGEQMVYALADEGARIVLTARDEEALEHVASAAATETLVVPADVTEETQVQAVVDEALETFGQIDTLVNNAGIGLLSLEGTTMPIVDVPVDRWRQIIEVNVTGVFLFTRAVLPSMAERGRGNLVNISSGAGRRGIPGWSPYVTSKWGVEGLTQTAALEHEDDGVNVNGLDPGGRVDTAFWDHLPDEERSEILRPDVMNEAAVLLAAQGPDGVTGESMPAADWEERLG